MALTTITGQPVGALYHGLTMRENICKTNHNSIYLFRIKSSRIPSWPQLCSATTHGTHHPTWDCVVLGTELRASCILDMNRHGRQASTSLDLHCFALFFFFFLPSLSSKFIGSSRHRFDSCYNDGHLVMCWLTISSCPLWWSVSWNIHLVNSWQATHAGPVIKDSLGN